MRRVGRVLTSLGLVLLVFLAAVVIWYLVESLSGSGRAWRLVMAAFMSLVIGWFGIGYFRQLQHPPPPELPPIDVHPSLRLAYVCEMCGLELSVLKAAKEKAPKHCGEEMVLIRRPPDQH